MCMSKCVSEHQNVFNLFIFLHLDYTDWYSHYLFKNSFNGSLQNAVTNDYHCCLGMRTYWINGTLRQNHYLQQPQLLKKGMISSGIKIETSRVVI